MKYLRGVGTCFSVDLKKEYGQRSKRKKWNGFFLRIGYGQKNSRLFQVCKFVLKTMVATVVYDTGIAIADKEHGPPGNPREFASNKR